METNAARGRIELLEEWLTNPRLFKESSSISRHIRQIRRSWRWHWHMIPVSACVLMILWGLLAWLVGGDEDAGEFAGILFIFLGFYFWYQLAKRFG